MKGIPERNKDRVYEILKDKSNKERMSRKCLTWVPEIQEKNRRGNIGGGGEAEHFPYWLKTVGCRFKKFDESQDK